MWLGMEIRGERWVFGGEEGGSKSGLGGRGFTFLYVS